jgi:hypothetical protein
VIPDQSAVGAIGVLVVATRGPDGPGEVMLRIGGGTEAYLAWSEAPLPRGSEVLVFNSRGDRSVDVMQFDSEPDSLI